MRRIRTSPATHTQFAKISGFTAVFVSCAIAAFQSTCGEEGAGGPSAVTTEKADKKEPSAAVNMPMQEGSPHWSNTLDTGEQDSESRPLDWILRPLKGGNVVVPPVEEFPRIEALDVDDPDRFWYTWRHNLTGQDIPHEWDFYAIIATDRPDFTDATFSVGERVVYWETGYTYRSIIESDRSVSYRSLPEVLVRSGITDEFELRVRWAGYGTYK